MGNINLDIDVKDTVDILNNLIQCIMNEMPPLIVTPNECHKHAGVESTLVKAKLP